MKSQALTSVLYSARSSSVRRSSPSRSARASILDRTAGSMRISTTWRADSAREAAAQLAEQHIEHRCRLSVWVITPILDNSGYLKLQIESP